MRPIYSPSDFIQMKGRGTRKNNFLSHWIDQKEINESIDPNKENLNIKEELEPDINEPAVKQKTKEIKPKKEIDNSGQAQRRALR